MNLRDLRYVVAVAKHGHFGKAATACHVSQPTLSAQISKLEETLGVKLFERLPREIRITQVGAVLIARAEKIVQDADDLVAVARQLENPLAGELRLGLIPTSGPYLLPHILKPLREAMPQLEILPSELQSAKCLAALEAGDLDAVILALPYSGAERFAQINLFDEAFEVLMPEAHELAKAISVPVTEISSTRLLLLDQGHCLRDHALSFCKLPAAAENYRATSLETLRNLVAVGMGVTLLPELAARLTQSEGTVSKPITPNSPGRRMSLLYRRSCPKLIAVHKLAEVIKALELPLQAGKVTLPN